MYAKEEIESAPELALPTRRVPSGNRPPGGACQWRLRNRRAVSAMDRSSRRATWESRTATAADHSLPR